MVNFDFLYVIAAILKAYYKDTCFLYKITLPSLEFQGSLRSIMSMSYPTRCYVGKQKVSPYSVFEKWVSRDFSCKKMKRLMEKKTSPTVVVTAGLLNKPLTREYNKNGDYSARPD